MIRQRKGKNENFDEEFTEVCSESFVVWWIFVRVLVLKDWIGFEKVDELWRRWRFIINILEWKMHLKYFLMLWNMFKEVWRIRLGAVHKRRPKCSVWWVSENAIWELFLQDFICPNPSIICPNELVREQQPI